MIQPVYKFPVIAPLRYYPARSFDQILDGPEMGVLTFLLRRESSFAARYHCISCENATGRSFETYAFPVYDPVLQKSPDLPDHIVDQMRRHVDDHMRIGAVETHQKTVLTKEETRDLAEVLTTAVVPRRLNPLLRKLGIDAR